MPHNWGRETREGTPGWGGLDTHPLHGDPQGRVAPRGGEAGKTLSRQGSSTADLALSIFELLSCHLPVTRLARGRFREPRGGSVSLILCPLLRSHFSSTRSCSLPSVIKGKGKGNNNEPCLQRSTPCSSVSWTNKMPDDVENFKV